ncbi:MAG: glycosyltransferase family 4 protein [Fidelibacterota bacterium]
MSPSQLMVSTSRKNWKKLKILILAHYYPPEMGGGAARVHGLARWLVKLGHDITVITGFPNYPSGIVRSEYRGKLRGREERDHVAVIRTWVYPSSHRTSMGRLSNYFSFVLSSIVTGLSLRDRHDVVVASSPPLFIGIAGRMLSRIRHIPFVFDIRDIWPDVAVDAGAFKPDSIFIRSGRRLARYLYMTADHLTPVTEVKCEKIVDEGADRHKVSVIPNGVDFDRLNQGEAGRWRAELDLDNRFVVAYTGLIGIAQGVGIIVEAAHYLKKNPSIHFLIVGDGVERRGLVKKVNDLNLENVTFVPSLPRREVPSVLASADIAVVPLVSGNLADAVPSKLMEAWACHRAVLLVARGEAAQLVETARGGVVVPPQQPRRLAEAVAALSEDSQILNGYAENGYAFVQTHFDRRDLARRMENVLMRVCLGVAP